LVVDRKVWSFMLFFYEKYSFNGRFKMLLLVAGGKQKVIFLCLISVWVCCG